MKLFIRCALLLSVLLTAAGCSDGGKAVSTGPDVGSALVSMPGEDRRIGIVHSETSKQNFYDPFAYNQLFAAMQNQATMAGVPFDLLSEDDLLSADALLQYDALLIPSFSHVQNTQRNTIRDALLQAQNAGTSIITSGELMAFRSNGQSYPDAGDLSRQLLGLNVVNYLSGVAATVNVATAEHPITSDYNAGEEIVAYQQIWFAGFSAVEGETATILTTVSAEGEQFVGAQIIERPGPVVHFANEQVMADNNLLWSTLRWAVYGDVAPVSLQLSRNDSVFIARNDMDQAMIAASLTETEIPLLDIITDWKNDYNFVGSYYIDIGNNPALGQYTDWGVSAPLYRDYIALGSEIGTHSWTHPHYTSNLTATELEFEFNQSKNKISTEIGVPVVGGAIPGNAESLAVVEELNQWFSYFSGRSGNIGSGYQNAIGFLEPQHDMLYFSLNMAPDFTLIDFLNYSPQQATQIWSDEIDHLLKHAETPVLHWLWHDYGPTTQTAIGRYNKAMFTDTLEHAYNQGTEFTTLENLHDRIRAFQSADLVVGTGDTVEVTLDASGVGQLALEVRKDRKIRSVQNWYAYDDNQVFVSDAGGSYSIRLGNTPDDVTRISALPMRARLLAVTGDGNELDFTFDGEGEVEITLSTAMQNNVSVSGPASFDEQQGVLTLQFDNAGVHSVSLRLIAPINSAPEAIPQTVSTETQSVAVIMLTGSDADGDALQYQVTTPPQHGTLSGNGPRIEYLSDAGFTGVDSFEFIASDGALDSSAASVSINVTLPRPANTAPVANRQVLETLVDQPLAFVLSGSDNENQLLTYQIVTQPASGTIVGTAPNLQYVPNGGYAGIDELQFTVNDGDKTSAAESIVFNINPQLVIDGGTLSNPLGSVVIDGDLSEWAGLQSFGADADDVSGANNLIDWGEAWMGHDASQFYIAYTQFNASNITWGHSIYLDTDTDSSTGFHGFSSEFPLGADYVLEGNSLFKYTTVAQNQWSWEYVQSVPSRINAQNVEISLPRSLIANPVNLDLFFYGDSVATGGSTVDLFPDQVTDSQALLKQRKFSYSVNPNTTIGNVAPVANAQQISINSNARVELLMTGTDINGDALIYTLLNSAANGQVTGQPPLIAYQPADGFVGTETLSFTVSDGALTSNAVNIEINVVAPPAVNSAPQAISESLSAVTGTALPIVLNGSDAEGSALVFSIVSEPQHGALTGTPPDLTYAAVDGFLGTDSFSFKVNDGSDDSAIATVTIEVGQGEPVNTAPSATSQSVTTAYETALGIALSGSDIDGQTLTYRITADPLKGSLQGSAPALTYVPFEGASGADVFSFVVNDGIVDSQPASVVINILPVQPSNRPPLANGQTLSTAFAQALSISLSAVDPEQQPLSYTIVQQPVSGGLSGSGQSYVYTPNADFSGLDSFQFVASDGTLSSDVATVTINVGTAPNGLVSNPVSGISIDGVISDWAGVASFGLDPDDVTGPNNPLDWRELWVAHDSSNIYMAYRNDGAFELSWGHGIYIDTDNNINTGFRGFSSEYPLGADILIESDDVHRYTGSGTNWTWVTEGATEVAVGGDIGELSVSRQLLGNPQDMRIYLRAVNTPYGGIGVDHYPDAAINRSAADADRTLGYSTGPQ